MLHKISLQANISEKFINSRLDQALAILFPQFSRSRIKQWILKGFVHLNGISIYEPKLKLKGGEEIQISALLEDETINTAEDLPLNIIFEDEDILVIDKPANFVVHPGAGNKAGTMLNALLHYYPKISEIPRSGIIHRIDKDTTGLLVVAKSIPAHTKLVSDLQNRTITREYDALAKGIIKQNGVVNAPIARHKTKRTQMAVINSGKPAVTHFKVVEHLANCITHLKLKLETGRTHQIRVHMNHIKHPLLGDQVYGGNIAVNVKILPLIKDFKRQALHASRLKLIHPINGEVLEFKSPLPDDLQNLIKSLKNVN